MKSQPLTSPIALAAALALLLLATPAHADDVDQPDQAQADEQALVQTVLDGQQRNLSAITSLEAEFVVREQSNTQNNIKHRELQRHLIVMGDRVRNRVKLIPQPPDPQESVYISDSCVTDTGSKLHNPHHKRGRVSSEQVDMDFPISKDLGFTYSFMGGNTLADIIAHRSSAQTLDNGLIQITAHVKGEGYLSLTVDPQRGFAVVEVEAVTEAGVLVGLRSDVEVQNQGGAWIITACRDEIHTGGIEIRGPGATSTTTLDVTALRINHLVPADAFELDFPKGTLVTNVDNGELHHVGEPQ